jgi:hypothetical protein
MNRAIYKEGIKYAMRMYKEAMEQTVPSDMPTEALTTLDPFGAPTGYPHGDDYYDPLLKDDRFSHGPATDYEDNEHDFEEDEAMEDDMAGA